MRKGKKIKQKDKILVLEKVKVVGIWYDDLIEVFPELETRGPKIITFEKAKEVVKEFYDLPEDFAVFRISHVHEASALYIWIYSDQFPTEENWTALLKCCSKNKKSIKVFKNYEGKSVKLLKMNHRVGVGYPPTKRDQNAK